MKLLSSESGSQTCFVGGASRDRTRGSLSTLGRVWESSARVAAEQNGVGKETDEWSPDTQLLHILSLFLAEVCQSSHRLLSATKIIRSPTKSVKSSDLWGAPAIDLTHGGQDSSFRSSWPDQFPPSNSRGRYLHSEVGGGGGGERAWAVAEQQRSQTHTAASKQAWS